MLGISSTDVIILFASTIIVGVFLALGLERVYQTFFGAVLGLGIYILLATLMSSDSWTHTGYVFSEHASTLVVGSSIYLIPLLSLLVPLNGAVRISVARNPYIRTAVGIPMIVLLILFFLAIMTGFSERVGIFDQKNAFSLFADTSWYAVYKAATIHDIVLVYLQPIVVVGTLATIYKFLFSEIIHALAASLVENIRKKRHADAPADQHFPEDE